VVSNNGSVIAFDSDATDLVNGLTLAPGGRIQQQVFVWNQPPANTNTLVTHVDGSPKVEANGFFTVQGISGNGQFILFGGSPGSGVSPNESLNQMGSGQQEYLDDTMTGA